MAPLPPPYVMCSADEISDRQRHMELHILESTSSTYSLHPRLRVADPSLAVKKYRRSAAGGGVSKDVGAGKNDDDCRHRTLDDLETTVSYLLDTLLPRQRSHDASMMLPRSLAEVASFVDDRVRAVQVDLTTGGARFGEMGASGVALAEGAGAGGKSSVATPRSRKDHWSRVRAIQARLVRYNLSMLHLLSEAPSQKYESKFGWTALRTALGAYFDAWDNVSSALARKREEEEERENDHDDRHRNDDSELTIDDDIMDELDEISSYAAMMHIASVLRSREASAPSVSSPLWMGCMEENGEGLGAILVSRARRTMVLAEEEAERRRCSSSSSRRRRLMMSERRTNPDGGRCGTNGGIGSGGRIRRWRKWTRALYVASAADVGNYVRVFRLLCDNDGDDDDDNNNDKDGTNSWRRRQRRQQQQRRYRILLRCCALPCVNAMRIDALRQWNKTYGKGERISASDVSELLRLLRPEDAVALCSWIGLPTIAVPDIGDDEEEEEEGAREKSTKRGAKTRHFVVMKAAPVCIPTATVAATAAKAKEVGPNAMLRRMSVWPGREEDAFVFGALGKGSGGGHGAGGEDSARRWYAWIGITNEETEKGENTMGVARKTSDKKRGKEQDQKKKEESKSTMGQKGGSASAGTVDAADATSSSSSAGMSSLQLALAKMKLGDGQGGRGGTAPTPALAPDDWEDRDEDDSFQELAERDIATKATGSRSGGGDDDDDDDDVPFGDLERNARVDEDGVIVPPGRVLYDLVK